MAYVVKILKHASRQLKKLQRSDQERIRAEIDRLKEDPRHAGTKKLTNKSALYRARAGDLRILYFISDKASTVTVVEIAHRRDVY